MRFHSILMIFLAIIPLVPATLASAAITDDFTPRVWTSPGGQTLPYELRIPPGYDKSKKYPVILYFHGAGERGTDNKAQLANGLETFSRESTEIAFPCFVIAPQCPQNQQWVDMPWNTPSGTRPAQPSASMKLALEILDHISVEFNIDPNRVYAIGLSMGGFAVWDCVTRFPERFAAGLLTCGGGDEKTVTPEVARVPVWAFHSSDDPIVPVARDRNMIKAMTDAGGHPLYIEYNYLGHGCWFTSWIMPDILPWLFSQDLSKRPKTPPVQSGPIGN